MKSYKYIWIIVLMAAMAVMASCSTQKNTWASRSFHQTKVKYNIYYNGNIAYEEGLRAISNANEDDYSTILNLYPVSNHQAAESSASQMEKTIEKCRKCIKLHSIKAKPKADPKKRNDPAYRAWLQQEEFNNQMGNAWIRLGEAEFHKGDFLGSIGTFTYVSRHYEHDADMVARCQLWMARAYAELGWLYEADDMLKKVQVDALSRKHAPLYSAVSADILLKTKQYHEAIPFLKIALPAEKRNVYRPRFQYVLGQLYEREGKRQDAADAYQRVIRMAPAPEMEFNARLHRAQLQGKNAVKQLQRMTKQSKNKDQLDQIYGTIGNIYLASGDTAKALENYQLAIEQSTKPGLPKAAVLITAGDLYFDRRDYIHAQPLYREASSLISTDHPDYARIEKRSQTLDELIVEYTAVQLQDSLQRLSKLSEEEQRAVAEKIVADLIAAEKEAEEKAAQAAREAEHGGLQSVDTRNMIGGGGQTAEWYFYNPQLMRSGKQDFARKWGTRPLEDNWRRLSKAASVSFVTTTDEDDDSLGNDSISADSIAIQAPITDIHKPEYYLQQIPKTEQDIAASDSIIAGALNNMVYIYQDKMNDSILAGETLDELARRFPSNSYLVDLYYMKYLEALKHNDPSSAEDYRGRIMRTFPQSKQAQIVSDPNYFERLRTMAHEQDSLYESTYHAYTHGDYRTVKGNKQYAEQAYPLSPLMPRFVFLNAVAVARSEGQDAFVTELRDMVARYPESELGAMAKDMLAMMGQGMESQTGTSNSSLADLRAEVNEPEDETASGDDAFSPERKGSSYVLIVVAQSDDEQMLNRLQYQAALFNFSQFLIRDFDIQKLPVFGTGCALRIAGFDSIDEALWYMGMVEDNAEFQSEIRAVDGQMIPITEENYPLLNKRFTLDEYRTFLQTTAPAGKK